MLNQLETLRQSVETVVGLSRKTAAPFSMRWGLYVGNSLYPHVRRVYFQHFQQLLFGPGAGESWCRRLRRFPLRPDPTISIGPAYDTLKAYLITTSNHDKSTVAFLSPVLLKAWAAGRDIDQARMELAQKAVRFLQRAVARRESLLLGE